jgi:phage terminase Nu1 subunit (DNA packaging protein)
MLTMSKLCKSSKLSKAELNKQLQNMFGITQPSVSEWWRKGIPTSRQIEIVRHFKLDPKILITSR